VEDWQIAYHKAQLAWDVQDLVTECIDLGNLAERAWDYLLDRVFDDSAKFDHETVGESMSIALGKALFVFVKVEKVIRDLERVDCPPIDNLDEFRRIVMTTTRINKEFEEQWPSLDEDRAEEALAAYNRGEHQSVGALLDETRRQGSEAD
jgi:hypothetical protein